MDIIYQLGSDRKEQALELLRSQYFLRQLKVTSKVLEDWKSNSTMTLGETVTKICMGVLVACEEHDSELYKKLEDSLQNKNNCFEKADKDKLIESVTTCIETMKSIKSIYDQAASKMCESSARSREDKKLYETLTLSLKFHHDTDVWVVPSGCGSKSEHTSTTGSMSVGHEQAANTQSTPSFSDDAQALSSVALKILVDALHKSGRPLSAQAIVSTIALGFSEKMIDHDALLIDKVAAYRAAKLFNIVMSLMFHNGELDVSQNTGKNLDLLKETETETYILLDYCSIHKCFFRDCYQKIIAYENLERLAKALNSETPNQPQPAYCNVESLSIALSQLDVNWQGLLVNTFSEDLRKTFSKHKGGGESDIRQSSSGRSSAGNLDLKTIDSENCLDIAACLIKIVLLIIVSGDFEMNQLEMQNLVLAASEIIVSHYKPAEAQQTSLPACKTLEGAVNETFAKLSAIKQQVESQAKSLKCATRLYNKFGALSAEYFEFLHQLGFVQMTCVDLELEKPVQVYGTATYEEWSEKLQQVDDNLKGMADKLRKFTKYHEVEVLEESCDETTVAAGPQLDRQFLEDHFEPIESADPAVGTLGMFFEVKHGSEKVPLHLKS